LKKLIVLVSYSKREQNSRCSHVYGVSLLACFRVDVMNQSWYRLKEQSTYSAKDTVENGEQAYHDEFFQSRTA
jgi:hypothetical protein